MTVGIEAMGKRITRLRERAGFSQTELAERVHVHQTHISQIEKGQKFPSIELLAGLARELETNSDYLLGLTDDDAPHSDLEDQVVIGAQTEEEKEALTEIGKNYKKLCKTGQQLVRQTIRELLAPHNPRIIGDDDAKE
jgi:transcriptional regulator with XRE-family HTH domain